MVRRDYNNMSEGGLVYHVFWRSWDGGASSVDVKLLYLRSCRSDQSICADQLSQAQESLQSHQSLELV